MRKFLSKNWLKKYDIFWETRTRIFAWYVGLSAVLVGLSIPLFTRLAIIQVDERVREDLLEEIEVFEEFLTTEADADLATIFDSFLRNKIPGDKTFLIATIDGEFYRSSPVSLPEAIGRDSAIIRDLADTTTSITENNLITDAKVGDIIYNAEPIKIDGEVRGVLIVANIPDGEREEVINSIAVIVEVLLSVFMLAVIFAWVIAGRVLQPVRSLIDTANTINEKNLTQRIPVRGNGEMAQLAKTFNNMMNRLEAAFQSQRQFINDASHELRTPITIVSGHLELLEYSEPREIAETMPIVLDELERMARFVDDLLLLAKAERKDFLILKPIDLKELTLSIYSKIRVLGERKWQLDNIAVGTITVDPQRIVQAMLNLAQNAVQNTKTTDTITLGSAIEDGQIRLWITDTGVGIPFQDRERIFDRFARSGNNRANSQGAGLGLSIVSAIAQSHNGCVELYSKVDKGSTFTVVIPTIDVTHRSIYDG